MPDESTPAPKSIAEDFKEKSPQVVIATTIALLSELLGNATHAKVLKICAPVLALVIVLLVTKLTELGIFLFKFYNAKPSESEQLDVRLKTYIKESERKLFWMRKSNSDYPELLEHTRLLRKRLRSYELGRLKLNVALPSTPTTPPTAEQ